MLDTHGSKPTKQQEPVAWGEFYGGKIVAVSLHKSHHYTVPLYTHPPEQTEVRPIDEWHEDYGDVVWWARLEGEWIGEAAWIGTPNDSDWPGYHTHWSPHPPFPPPLKAAIET